MSGEGAEVRGVAENLAEAAAYQEHTAGAMRHLALEIEELRDTRARDAMVVPEAIAAVSARVCHVGTVGNGGEDCGEGSCVEEIAVEGSRVSQV